MRRLHPAIRRLKEVPEGVLKGEEDQDILRSSHRSQVQDFGQLPPVSCYRQVQSLERSRLSPEQVDSRRDCRVHLHHWPARPQPQGDEDPQE